MLFAKIKHEKNKKQYGIKNFSALLFEMQKRSTDKRQRI